MKNPELTNIRVSKKDFSDEYLSRRISGIKESFYKALSIIDGIPHKKIQLIAMFALLDSMAQEAKNYQWEIGNPPLRDFIIKHSKTHDYIERVEPITLLYHFISQFFKTQTTASIEKHTQEIFEQLGYDWEHMEFSYAISGQIVEKVVAWATKNGVSQKQLDKIKEEHTIANLLVQMRNKAMHEMTGLGTTYRNDSDRSEPYYEESTRLYSNDFEYALKDEIVSLIIPNRFIRTLLLDCIDGYLEDCFLHRRIPYSNNKMTRNYILTWYN